MKEDGASKREIERAQDLLRDNGNITHVLDIKAYETVHGELIFMPEEGETIFIDTPENELPCFVGDQGQVVIDTDSDFICTRTAYTLDIASRAYAKHVLRQPFTTPQLYVRADCV